MTQLILNPRFEQSIILLFQRAKCNDTVAATDMWDISNETPHELGTIEKECDENSCQVESVDAVVGMSSQDHVYVGDAAIVGVGACEDTIISAATSVLVEPSNEEFSSMHVVVDVCSKDTTLVIDDEGSDTVVESCYIVDQHSVDVHFMDNPMFDVDATWSYDNPLFEVDVDHSPEWSWTQFSPTTDSVQFSVAKVGDVLAFTSFGVATPIVDTVGMSAYGSPVATSFSGIIGGDQDSTPIYIMWVHTGKKRMHRYFM